MLFNSRIIHKDNATFVDASMGLTDLGGDGFALTFVVADDYLYIGSDLPFTHRYFKLGTTVNAAAATVSEIAIWEGNAWAPAVDIQDGTKVGISTLARSGVISWTTDRNENWQREETTEDIPDLATLKIYGLYWTRWQFTANLTAAISLQYVGHRFANDADLALQYPDLMLTATLTAFKSGKTDWQDQHVLAAEEIIRYLQRHGELWSPNQILNWQRFTNAAVHKCAEIAYSAFSGEDMEVLRARAQSNYKIALNQGCYNVDRNQDGHVQLTERAPNVGLTRS